MVVGSGFGGSIAALRLAQAGKSVLVLERGRRWRPGEFPRDVTDTDTLLWEYPRRRSGTGLFDLRFMRGLAAVVASGVGGGSLVYANIHIRPDASVFDDPRWPAEIDRAALDPYYDRVASELSIQPLPADERVPKRDAYRAAAGRLGYEVFDPDEAVSWRAGAGPGRGRCELVAECEFGCQLGAKNTLDVTYLAEAERLGTQVLPSALATAVEPAAGGYRVRYATVPGGEPASVTGTRVVVSAGTLGTNELLLRSRDVARTMPELSPHLGCGYSGNGDFLGSVMDADVELEPWLGPDVTSVIKRFDQAPGFTLAAPTFNRSVMAVLTALGQPRAPALGPLAPLLWPLLGRFMPWALRHGLLSRAGHSSHDPARTTFLFAIGQDNAGGRLRLRRGRLDLDWNYAREHKALIDRMEATMRAVGDEYGGTFSPLVSWLLFRRITTVHSLGGCHPGPSADRGVVSPDGQVHGYPGLFVSDGSVIPTSLGFHPAMTIAAVSERTADAVVASYP